MQLSAEAHKRALAAALEEHPVMKVYALWTDGQYTALNCMESKEHRVPTPGNKVFFAQLCLDEGYQAEAEQAGTVDDLLMAVYRMALVCLHDMMNADEG